MTERFFEIAFTSLVRAAQEANGSRSSYARLERSAGGADLLGKAEADFIASRDSFYMATVSETGWPYLQHRGGPAGFVKVLGASILGMAEFRGNRQYITLGNISQNQRAALFFMDYANRRRLKLLARVRVHDLAEDEELSRALIDPGYRAQVERALVFDVEAYDWNCPQHITPRFTALELEPVIAQLKQRIAELEAENGSLRELAAKRADESLSSPA